MHPIMKIVTEQKAGAPAGISSCCSANEYVIKACLERSKRHGIPALIESTANQVNQFGGYTGMTPEMFRTYVEQLAQEVEYPLSDIILGGDHLGPLTWTDLPNEEAMANASELITSYVLAGFTKIHIDTSMRLAEDDQTNALPVALVAERGALLCSVAEAAYKKLLKDQPGAPAPVYIIGSEVPIPGGAQEEEESVQVTSVAACEETYRAFKAAFMEERLTDVWQRVAGLVVQPGVEFGSNEIFDYSRESAAELIAYGKKLPIVFEGHSTDYQTPAHLLEMVEDGIAILKVGPAYTFALREALFSLELIERELLGNSTIELSKFRETLEQAMLDNPGYWKSHYHGTDEEQRFARAFSLSDRARYYLPQPSVQGAIDTLLANLATVKIPLNLLSQYLPRQYQRVRSQSIENKVETLLIDRVGDCVDDYMYACGH